MTSSKRLLLLAGVFILLIRTSTAFSNPCPADVNSDGEVNINDLEIMKTEMGRDNCYSSPCRADLDGDGKVNGNDGEILIIEFGRKDCLFRDGDMLREQIETFQIQQEEGFITGDEEEEEIVFKSEEGEKTEESIEPPISRFKDNGNGTVSDPKTGLIWTKDANLPSDTMLFHQALDYIKEINEGKYSNFGYTDWRLPTLREIRSLIDYTKLTSEGHVLPDGHPFDNVQSLNFNSRSAYISNSDYPLFVSLYCRLVGHNVNSCYGYVWPVRGDK